MRKSASSRFSNSPFVEWQRHQSLPIYASFILFFEGIKDIAEVLKPASTYVISPVIPLARSEHKKAATFPTSSVVTALPKGALSAYL